MEGEGCWALPCLHLFISYPIVCLLTGEVVGLPGLLARGFVQRVFGAVLVPQVEVAEDGVGAVDLTRGARQVEVVGEDVSKRRFDLFFMRVAQVASRNTFTCRLVKMAEQEQTSRKPIVARLFNGKLGELSWNLKLGGSPRSLAITDA